jgi:RNA polymerase sigma-70 factor (ECF subfamily)
MCGTEDEARAAAAGAARRSYGKLVAYLAARTRDVASAEDALADAFASALFHWPASGIPENPEAWLLATARRSAFTGDWRTRHPLPARRAGSISASLSACAFAGKCANSFRPVEIRKIRTSSVWPVT